MHAISKFQRIFKYDETIVIKMKKTADIYMTIFFKLHCIVKNCMQVAKISGFGKCILIVGKICMPLANSSGYYIIFNNCHKKWMQVAKTSGLNCVLLRWVQ
jgi:hypothetical protein